MKLKYFLGLHFCNSFGGWGAEKSIFAWLVAGVFLLLWSLFWAGSFVCFYPLWKVKEEGTNNRLCSLLFVLTSVWW